ncbi:MAG: glycoside-pentoside-hexuronide (GPH):cation symporter [Spirochaetales bacterium]|nr:glycoside-pentoside-hexuronide (GPH):cation symporter [Spirochaetales bacterium]MCF7938521.1 glycoside-pentoside-hexuronide (GPH):cation symporter [Spirochaetales bacterium]
MKKQVGLGIKIGYGTSELGTTSVEVLLRLYLLIVYTDIVGLRPALAGYAVALAVIWDAVTDPLMGFLSDATRTRWGRRRPYILIGGLLLAGSLLLLFEVPELSGQTAKFLYLLLIYILVNTGMTIITVPQAALGREITFDRDERTEVYGWRLLFGNFGFLAGTVLPGILLASLGNNAGAAAQGTAYARAAELVAGVVVLTALITFFSTRGVDLVGKEKRPSAAGRKKLLRFLASVMSNKVFLPLVLSYFVFTIGLSINSATALYYYRYGLLLGEQNTQLVLSVFILVFSFSLFLWVLISRKLGKKWPAFWAALFLGILSALTYPFLPPGEVFPIMVVAVSGGVLVGAIVLLESLVADTVDYDELKTGRNREGIYFGFWKLSNKFARAIAIAVAGNLLDWIGYVPNQLQTPEVSFSLSIIFGPVVGGFWILAALIFLFMPLTDDRHRRIQQILDLRRRREERTRPGGKV